MSRKVGYRHIDTAQSYFNEEEVGNAIRKSGIPRKELFITTKVWIEHYGYEECRKSVLGSLRKMQLDYLDLVLLHQPFAGRHLLLLPHKAYGQPGGNAPA